MTPEQQTPASVVERLRAPHGSAYRFIAAALIERLSAEREGLAERLEVAAVHLQLAGGWLREAGDDGQRANTLVPDTGVRVNDNGNAYVVVGEG